MRRNQDYATNGGAGRVRGQMGETMGFRLLVLTNLETPASVDMVRGWPEQLQAEIPGLKTHLSDSTEEASDVIGQVDAIYGKVDPDAFAKARKLRAVYIGDGYSDRCAVSEADVVFAKDSLAVHCKANDIPYHSFESLADVQAWVTHQTPTGEDCR